MKSSVLAISRSLMQGKPSSGGFARFFSSSNFDLFGEMKKHQSTHAIFKNSLDLNCIIALSELGGRENNIPRPALGGCRFVEYTSLDKAVEDAIKLSEGMLYKSIMAGLELSGGKSVILKPRDMTAEKRKNIFIEYGRLLELVNGGGTRYITAMDSGTTVSDMDIIRSQTSFVASDSRFGDPSPFTARGVFKGILSTVSHVYGHKNLKNLTFAIQGAGGTAYYISKLLHNEGAKLIVCDIDPSKLDRFIREFGAVTVDPTKIYSVPADVFSPCALGGTLNEQSLSLLNRRVKVIAGSANNQVRSHDVLVELEGRGITYAPDYVINAGGLIHCVHSFYDRSKEETNQKIDKIPSSLLEIYAGSKSRKITTAAYADVAAQEKIASLISGKYTTNICDLTGMHFPAPSPF